MTGLGDRFRTTIAAVLKAMALTACLYGCAVGPATQVAGETPTPTVEQIPAATTSTAGAVRPGDLVRVDFAIYTKDGELVQTSMESLAIDAAIPRHEVFVPPDRFSPELIVAVEEADGDPMGRAVVGLTENERCSVDLSPEQGFGAFDPQKIMHLPRTKRLPVRLQMKPEAYVKRFGTFPVEGKQIFLVPYFPALITKVDLTGVTLENRVTDSQTYDSEFGAATVTVEGDELVITLAPRMGAPFSIEGRSGRIIESSAEAFKVDFNHPLAGEPLRLELQVRSITPATAFAGVRIDWITDHDAGYEAAVAREKPQVLVLYSETCGWSRKLLERTFTDPRLLDLRDRFVWTKVMSTKAPELNSFYELSGYPLIVITRPDGEIITKVDGYRDAAFMSRLMRRIAAEQESVS